MQVQTTRFGLLDLPDEAVLTFPEGLIGFETCTRFAIVDRQEGRAVWWLQSLDAPEVAFILTDPTAVLPGYAPALQRSDLDELGLAAADEAEVHVMLVVPRNPKEITANLLGPLVVNPVKHLGKQVVLHNSGYSPAHRLAQPVAAGAHQGTGEGGGR
ncbi:MAG: flagellar assembly protein FliW [Verrucomicrobia bacterium]|nr:flagellar assembly protein FliW [Verrucomicrobiota bacterium]